MMNNDPLRVDLLQLFIIYTSKKRPHASKKRPCMSKIRPCMSKIRPCMSKIRPCMSEIRPCMSEIKVCRPKIKRILDKKNAFCYIFVTKSILFLIKRSNILGGGYF